MQTQIKTDHWEFCDNYNDSSNRLTIHGPSLVEAVEQCLPDILAYIRSDVYGYLDVHLAEAFLVPASRNRMRGHLCFAELHLVSDWPARYTESKRAGKRRRVIPIYATPEDLTEITPLNYIKEK